MLSSGDPSSVSFPCWRGSWFHLLADRDRPSIQSPHAPLPQNPDAPSTRSYRFWDLHSLFRWLSPHAFKNSQFRRDLPRNVGRIALKITACSQFFQTLQVGRKAKWWNELLLWFRIYAEIFNCPGLIIRHEREQWRIFPQKIIVKLKRQALLKKYALVICLWYS